MPDYIKAAERAARKYGVDPAIFKAMIRQESGFNPNAHSPAGAQGIAQFMPGTAPSYGVNLHDNRVTDDLEGAAKYIAANLRRTGGNYHQALSIYNSGRPDAYKDPSFAKGQTYNYVRTILANAGQHRVSGRGGGGGSSAGAPSVPSSRTVTVTPGVDNTDARRQALASFLLSSEQDPVTGQQTGGDILSLALQMRQLQDQPAVTKTVTSPAPGAARQPRRSASTAQPAAGGGKVVHLDGKPVLSSFLPAIQYARAHGWKGTITSGVRTRAQQIQAAQHFGLQHYPNGPLASNHVEGHRGAIDVSDPDGFERALRGFRGRKPFRGMADDPVHFSWTGH